jgi:hypothetical protein
MSQACRRPRAECLVSRAERGGATLKYAIAVAATQLGNLRTTIAMSCSLHPNAHAPLF